MARKERRKPHGHGSVWRRGPSTFVVRWRENGERRLSPAYATRELAERVRSKIAADLQAGRTGLPRDLRDSPTLGSLGDAVLERRKLTHRSWQTELGRWKLHLRPFFGSRQASLVDPALIRSFVEKKRAEGMNPSTVGHCVRLLSIIYTDLIERTGETGVKANPVRSLTRATRRLYKPTHDPKNTPFIEKLADIARVQAALNDTTGVMFAVGAYAGLRPGEVKGLHWTDVDIEKRRIKVWRQVFGGELGPLKDDETRIVPILNPLLPILLAWKARTGGDGQLFRPLRAGKPGHPARFIQEHTLLNHLAAALEKRALPRITWYQATRHTFASRWVLNDGSIEKLASILGHSSTWVTERYAHLRPDLFKERDLAILDVSGTRSGTFGHSLGTESEKRILESTNSPLN